ncbi:PTS sugar transporter subunit IIA [Clostridium sp. D2Q-11]|uniref:Ascorbate-specific PTS system EIIA component n=1 Tax=Anaeromonas frigoriresistens TaxID=2683708 RepID=A0A942UYC5_9FIRM|nr:PTS sugar transporter subunit IIA [Anaeromonas frigoriresistens]MBS4537867.1 PTS sugar transporter subunit IIA [Anaeromonas frigoriresistens]
MIENLININTISSNVNASNWKDAVKKAGNLLLEEGFIEERYIEAMIDKVEELGPYIVIAPGIAMPHSRPEDGVNKTGVALITLEEGINFGHEKNDPVNLVIALAAKDNKSHIKSLSELMEVLGNEELLEKILNSNSSREIYECVNNK